MTWMLSHLDWALSFGTLYSMNLIGQKRREGWVVALANQVPWITYALVKPSYGLLPLALALTAIYARNWWRWKEEK